MSRFKSSLVPVRVKDIILDETHPEYQKYGKVESIGIIKYAPINRNTNSEDIRTLPPAYPLDQSSKSCPLVNEIVFLTTAVRGDSKDSKTDYYISPISIFNDINFNASYDPLDNTELGPGYEFPIDPKKRPLHPFHGDVILQGRHGQSLRFTGAKSFKNPFTNNSNNGSPLSILTTGHTEEEPSTLYIEDINKDKSSLYLASDHLVPLEQIRDKYAGAVNRPVIAKNYRGAQAILNSGRLYFNAYDDDILISSKNNFSATSEQISLDGVSSIGLDAKKIYLGEKALRFELQPVLLGNQTEIFLFELLSTLERLADALSKAKTANQIPVPNLIINGISMKATIKGLLNQINPNGESRLKSKKVFTE